MTTSEASELVIPLKTYIKPEVEQVRLLLEEAVLGTGCKTAASAGPSDPCEINFTVCLIQGS